MGLYNDQIQLRHNNERKSEPTGLPPLNGYWQEQFANGGLIQVLGCINLTLAPKGSYMNNQVRFI
jgi:hypothetical protein